MRRFGPRDSVRANRSSAHWDDLDPEYIGGLSGKVKKLTGKKVNAQILEHMPSDKGSSMFIGLGKSGEQ